MFVFYTGLTHIQLEASSHSVDRKGLIAVCC